MPALFDSSLRALRRDRAARRGPALFVGERVFEDLLERIAMTGRRFERALLIGCPDPAWRGRLTGTCEAVEAIDPGPLFAAALGGAAIEEDKLDLAPASFDLIAALGTLDSVDELPAILAHLAAALRPGGLLIGAISGGDTLPRLRSAMHAADRVSGGAQAHVHPRIEAAALAPLLAAAGLVRPVVDVDWVRVAYRSLDCLVADLRAMAATNVLLARPRRALSRTALAAATADFGSSAGAEAKIVETFEILNFAAWKSGCQRGDPN